MPNICGKRFPSGLSRNALRMALVHIRPMTSRGVRRSLAAADPGCGLPFSGGLSNMEQPSSRTATRRRWRVPFIAAAAVAMMAGVAAVAISSASAATVNTSAWYVFVNRNSGKAMDVWEWSTADGGQLRQFTRTNANNQQFQFVDVGSGYYQLRNRNSGKVVAIPNSNDGVQVVQQTA